MKMKCAQIAATLRNMVKNDGILDDPVVEVVVMLFTVGFVGLVRPLANTVPPGYTSGPLHLSSKQHLKSHEIKVSSISFQSVALQANSFIVLHLDCT